jgi:hypothetical protein
MVFIIYMLQKSTKFLLFNQNINIDFIIYKCQSYFKTKKLKKINLEIKTIV